MTSPALLPLVASCLMLGALHLAPAQEPPSSTTAAPSPATSPTPKSPRQEQDSVTPKPFRKYRHEGFLKRLTEGPVGLLFLGDSITDGWPAKGGDTWAQFAPYQPANFGVSAIRTEGLLWNITHGELKGINPKVTVVLIGVNNLLQCPDEKPEWAAAGIRKVVETVHTRLPNTRVLLLAIFPARNPATNPARTRIAEVNRLISTLDAGDRTRFLDIGKIFLADDGQVRRDLMPDGLHPNARGYQAWHKAMAPVLETMLK